MQDIPNSVLLDELTKAVKKAGKIIQDHWSKPRQIEHKGRIDLVTETDKAVEEHLKELLVKILPEADFLAEESAKSSTPNELTWIIDPLDGTTNFAHGIPVLAISVGLWASDRMELGAVYNPILEDLYTAGRGLGAWHNGNRMAVSKAADLETSLVATGFPYTVRERMDDVLSMLREALYATQGVRRCGAAAVDLAFTACGRLDGYFELGLWPWDTAAGWLLVEEAGGKVTKLDGSAYALGVDGILASNGRIHEELLRILLKK